MSRIRLITGTDTGVGKTLVAAALIGEALAAGMTPIYFKPVQTGVVPGAFGDADFVAAATGARTEEGSRWRLGMAPTVAAEQDGAVIDYHAMLQTAARLSRETELLVIEGAGGLLVPLAHDRGPDGPLPGLVELALDLGTERTEFVVVCRPGLGTLNHTRLTVEALRRRDLQVAGLVVGNWPANPGPIELTNLHELGRYAPVIGVHPHLPGLCSDQPTIRGAIPAIRARCD